MKQSLKPNKKRLITLCLVLTGLTALWLYVRPDRTQAPESGPQEEESEAPFSLSGETADQRAAFLLQYGWEVEMPEICFRQLEIPESFDEIYIAYNKIQREQGMDLLPFAGKTVEQYTYRVTNFPDPNWTVQAVVLVFEGKVIGGDLDTVELDGFLTGFAGPVENPAEESFAAEESSSVEESAPQRRAE